jgi:glycosyltransferase involved in cell wall biosynthesis
MLRDIYDVPAQKIELIPHGILDLPFADTYHYKQKLGLGGRKVILTFGLLSRNKGVEVVLKALPRVVRTEPSVLYIVLGATHPEVLRREGQSYKFKLEKMVKDLRLQRNVVFESRFVDNEELFQFLGAADVYVTPYLHKEQLTSGTLAFAVGTGKAVVSTPYWAAQELLAKGRGKLVRFGDSDHMARSIVEILTNNLLSSRMRSLAYGYGRSMTWPQVGRSYWELFRDQMPSMAIPSEPRFDALAWEMPVRSRQQIYQPA